MSVTSYAAAQLLKVVPRSAVSRALGALCEVEPPRAVLKIVLDRYSKAYRVALDEASPDQQPYRSFDAFFTRALRPGLRPIEGDAETLVSPADGKVSELGAIDDAGTMRVKGQEYRLDALLDDASLARRYAGGGFAVVYLSPRDYHRVHSPVAGRIARVRGVEGDRWPVNAIGEAHIPGLFVRNRRVVVEIETSAWGRVAVVFVGAMIVGRMTVACVDADDVKGEPPLNTFVDVDRGGELGAFHLGSTVVVAIERDRFSGFLRGPGAIRYGEALARAGGRSG
jgi:phosphatidylserine decarboxylase